MATHPKTVRAWSAEKFGKPEEILKLGELPFPDSLEANQLLIKVKAAALNPVDLYILQGSFRPETIKFPLIPSLDIAGIVEAIGSEVTRFQTGDEVYGFNWFPSGVGALAEYAIATESTLAKKPASLTFTEAAALPVALLTAFQSLEALGLQEGGKVLVTAGAGGVGVHAIQLAKKYFKAGEIVVTASKGKHDILKELGATSAIDYKSEDFSELLSGLDAVLDATSETAKALKVIKPGGKVLTIIEFTAGEDVTKLLVKPLGSDLEKLNPLFESGELKAVLDKASPFKFEDAISAFSLLASKQIVGKVVVEI